MKTITVRRKPYYRSDGTYVRGSTYKVRVRGKRGKTPKSGLRYDPQVTMNWSKDMPIWERRDNALLAHKGDLLATSLTLQLLANVTTDRATKREARKDALYFFKEYRRSK